MEGEVTVMETIRTALVNMTTTIATEGTTAIAAILPAAAGLIAAVAVVNLGLRLVRRVTSSR